MFKQSSKQVEEYKSAFNDNIDTLSSEIENILNKLDQDTKESKTLEQRVKENKEIAAWVASKESDIRTLLTF